MPKSANLAVFDKRKKALDEVLGQREEAERASKRGSGKNAGGTRESAASTLKTAQTPASERVSMPTEPYSRKPRKLPPPSSSTRYIGGKRTVLTEDLMDELCALVANGRPLTVTARDLGINTQMVFEWVGKYPEFAEKFNKAREAGSECLVDYATATLERVQDDDIQGPAVAAANALAQHLRWVAAKLKPKVYGDTLKVDQTTALTVKDERAQLRDKILAEDVEVIEGESHREADSEGTDDALPQRAVHGMVEEGA
jgi:hypothetical protein